ncbi:MAG: TolC family protein [Bacteroidota bacterium]|nr:TolC family protein [Bacteroidota bacterium]
MFRGKRIILSLITAFCGSLFLFGQNSKEIRNITIQQADSLFVARNLDLLAEKYNVDAVKAQIIQAKLFNNPTISINQNVVNSEYQTNGGRKWFDFTDKGETSVQLQKLFLLAGKRNKRINLAEVTALREEQNYFDMLRTLKFSLRSGFYTVYYLQKTLNVYDKEITSLSNIIKVFENQQEKGYASKKDVLRLKASLFSLENEKLGYSSQLISNMADFNVLMHTSNVYYIPQADTVKLAAISPESVKLQEVIDTAMKYRYDLKMAQSDLAFNQMNLNYQKALGVPDLTLSAGWDRNGSFIHNYNYVGVQIDLPFFNRNQGNIKTAQFTIESSKAKLQSAEDQVKSDVFQSYSNALETNDVYKHFDEKFAKDLTGLIDEIIKNYEKRNISLLEFMDFYDAYKQNMIQYNTLQNSRINAFENLNFSVGKDIINK